MGDDAVVTREESHVAVTTVGCDVQHWHCHTVLEKFAVPPGLRSTDLAELHALGARGYARLDGRNIGELERELLEAAGVAPEVSEVAGNLLVYGGAACQWQTLIGNGTTTAGQALTYFNNAQSALGVGDSTTAAAATQTDLQAATNKLRVGMDATYPSHTDGTSSVSAAASFRSTFSTAQANYAWQEWGVFNSPTAGTGRMLQRKVESLGTKTSASSWTLTVTLTLS
jgi:hypothetical protein